MGDVNTFALANEAGWNLPVTDVSSFPQFIQQTVKDELSGGRSKAYYQGRLKALGFEKMDRVLDAGCGTGQWAVALASLNKRVDAVDVDDDCLRFSGLLASSENAMNCHVHKASIAALPFAANTFDGITCYSVLMLCGKHPLEVFNEFNRVLKPGGKLYLSVDTWGWYLHLLIDQGILGSQRYRIPYVFRYFFRTLKHWITGKEIRFVLTKSFLRTTLAKAGFDIKAMSHEGGINQHKNEIGVRAAIPKRYYSCQAIIDLLAVKQ
jgi:ubiquinone/menaquinone biosynthesis C-methylase UbiE